MYGMKYKVYIINPQNTSGIHVCESTLNTEFARGICNIINNSGDVVGRFPYFIHSHCNCLYEVCSYVLKI